MAEVIVEVGDKEITFNVETDDFNQYLNEQMPNDKVSPAYNFLSRTVSDSDRDAFKKVALVDGKPSGLIVLQIAGVVAEAVGGDVEISIKKPKSSPSK